MLNWRIVCCWWTIYRLNYLRTEWGSIEPNKYIDYNITHHE